MRALLPLCCSFAFLVGCGDNATVAGRDSYVGGDGGTLSCVPDLDGTIHSRELPTVLDTPVGYLINPVGKDRPVDLVGKVDKAGKRVWDFGTDYVDDQALKLAANGLAGKWYALSFSTGSFVSSIDAAQTLDGVYRRDDTGLYLLGIASKTEAPAEGKTLLVYDAPIKILAFPLAPGARWISVGNVAGGTIRGLPYAGKDTYEVEDDGVGRLVLVDFTFEQAHRVRTKVTVSPAAGAAVSRRQVSWFMECFGEVARAPGKDNDPTVDFTVAAELRRLGQ